MTEIDVLREKLNYIPPDQLAAVEQLIDHLAQHPAGHYRRQCLA
jgi:hypothetical protein